MSKEMRIVSHKDGTYSIVGMTRSDVQEFERACYKDWSEWEKSASGKILPSGYDGWTLETYLRVNREIADRMYVVYKMLNAVAYPVKKEV